jgi:hypothetical protein
MLSEELNENPKQQMRLRVAIQLLQDVAMTWVCPG